MRDRKSDTAHRRALELKLGRALTPAEVAHHANEDKGDNSLSNLVAKPRNVHTSEHNKARTLSKLRASLRMIQERKKPY